MSSDDVNTGVSTTVAGFIKNCNGTTTTERIGACIRQISGLEKFLSCQTDQICYESICRFWEDVTIEEAKSFRTTVNGKEITVTEESIKTLFGFPDFTTRNDMRVMRENNQRLWEVMVKDMKKHPKILSAINVNELHTEFSKFSKIVAQNIIGNSGSLNTLSTVKIDIMTIIYFIMKFNWAGFILTQLMDAVKKENKAKNDGKKKKGRWCRGKKPYGFMIQTILYLNEVPLINPVKVNAMKVRDAKDAETSKAPTQKRRKKELVPQPVERKTRSKKQQSTAEEKERDAAVLFGTKEELEFMQNLFPPKQSAESEAPAELQEIPVEVHPVEEKTAESSLPAVSKPSKRKRQLTVKEEEEDDDNQTLEFIVKARKPQHKPAETKKKKVEWKKAAKKPTKLILSEKEQKKSQIATQWIHFVKKGINPADVGKYGKGKQLHQFTQEEREQFFGDALDTAAPNSPIASQQISGGTEECAEVTDEERFQQWLNWKLSHVSIQLQTASYMESEETWAFELLQIKHLGELLNVSEIVDRGLKAIQKRREKRPAEPSCPSPTSKRNDDGDSDGDDNDKPDDRDARKIMQTQRDEMIMQTQRDEMAGRFGGESSKAASPQSPDAAEHVKSVAIHVEENQSAAECIKIAIYFVNNKPGKD